MLSLVSSSLKTFNNQMNTKDIIKENELNKQLRENVFIPIQQKETIYRKGKKNQLE